MLYERWREIVRARKQEVALRDLASGQNWTFQELASAPDAARSDPIKYPRGQGADFILALLQAWRLGAVVCPLDNQQSPPAIDREKLPDNIVHLKITSATTGTARLVAFTAAQLAADASNIVRTMGLRPEWPNLGLISLAHSYGFSSLVTPLLLHGIPLILGGSTLPEQLRQILQSYPGVVLPAVPALWRTWHEAKVISPAIKLAISAGAPLPLPLETEVFRSTGVKLHNFYGATECGGIAYDAGETVRNDGAFIGQALCGVNVSLSSQGCLEVRSDAVGQGYGPQLAPDLSEGRYQTADLAEIISDQIYLRGRSSDLINIAGRKLAPDIVEQVLRLHPSVRECVVFGIPSDDPERSEEIVAGLSGASDLSSAQVRQFLLERLEAWQTPRHYWIVNDLAVNSRGKLSRTEWRARYLNDTGSGGDFQRFNGSTMV